jgi:hypothetical protein
MSIKILKILIGIEFKSIDQLKKKNRRLEGSIP